MTNEDDDRGPVDDVVTTLAPAQEERATRLDRPRGRLNPQGPTEREVAAYEGVLRLTRELGREPTADEVFPLLRDFQRFRGRTKLGGFTESRKNPNEIAARGDVVHAMRKLVARVSDYDGNIERVTALRTEVATAALSTLREAVAIGGPFDHDPDLLREKTRAAAEVARICGFSAEKIPTTTINVAQATKVEAAEDAGEVARLRRELYEARMGHRTGGAPPVIDAVPVAPDSPTSPGTGAAS